MKSAKAKVLHEVAGRTLVVWAVETALAAGARRVVVVVGHQRELVSELLADRYGDKVETVVQAQQNGTGDAVIAGLSALEAEADEVPIVVMSGDVPRFRSERIAALAEASLRASGKMAVITARAPDPTGYGRVVRDAEGKFVKIVEHADASAEILAVDEINSGFYGFQLGLLRREVAELSTDNAQGELYLTDVGEKAAQSGVVELVDAPFAEIRGINTRIDLSEVERAARRDICERLMLAGVTFADPASAFIDADVESIGEDTWIGPNVCLRGATIIGTGVRIDMGSVLTDVSVGNGAWIKPHSVLGEAKIGDEVQVGPFTHIRPGTVLDAKSKIGNFVEAKKAHLMSGSKANHLAYLGDVSVGQGANIGAGTITCNYDGYNKHKTTIEAGAFIGSDSQLVAPVTIGRDSYVGSGTTVTKDVPRSALALSRTKQVNIEGWADRYRDAQEKRRSRKG